MPFESETKPPQLSSLGQTSRATDARPSSTIGWRLQDIPYRRSLSPRIEGEMISDHEMRAVCEKALTRRDPAQEDEFLFALRAACEQYLRERSIFLAYSNPSPQTGKKRETSNSRKRVA